MSLEWIHEQPARWDAAKARIVGGAPQGIFDVRYQKLREGDLVPGEWWQVRRDGRPIGFGWMDVVWGDAEVLLAVAPDAQKGGAGKFILDHLEAEAAKRGLNMLYNLVRPTHPSGAALTAWMTKHGFKLAPDGNLVRTVKRG